MPPRKRATPAPAAAPAKPKAPRKRAAKATPPPPPDPRPLGVDDLDARGRELWDQLHTAMRYDPATEQLVLEACRIADRLAHLDQLLRGHEDEWIRLSAQLDWHGEFHGDVVLTINPVLAEARQQATALQRLLDKLQTKAQPKAKGPSLADLLAGDGAAAPAGQ